MGLALAPGDSEISIDEIKSRLRLTVDTHDDKLQEMLDAALAAYTRYVAPLPGSVTETFDGGTTALVLRSQDASAVTAASYDNGTEITTSDLLVENGIVRWGYGTDGRFTYGRVSITYTVGALDADHREAIIADTAGYFAATQRAGTAQTDENGYTTGFFSEPMTLFPRIMKLAPPAIA